MQLPRVTTKEPERTAERRLTHYSANVPLPAIAFTYLTPPEKNPDAEPLRVAATILAQGESSRLYRSLIYDQQVAQSADATPDLREDAGVFYFNVVLASGKKPEEGERALLEEIKKIQNAPVSMAELDKAKNQLVTNELRQRETSNGKALALGSSAVLLGDPNRVNTDLAKLQAVTVADIQRVMKKYFTDANRLVIYYLPESTKAEKITGSTLSSTPTTLASNQPLRADITRDKQNMVAVAENEEPKYEPPKDSKGKLITGRVVVEVLVGEGGNVIEASAKSGPRELREIAANAAMGAKFSPTIKKGKAMQVRGSILYNFVDEKGK